MNYRKAMAAAYKEAASSPDRSTQNGAIIFLGGRPLVFAHNRFPKGIDPDDERVHERSLKNRLIIHAEMGAICEVARHKYGLDFGCDATMVCPWACCPRCAQAIIEGGIQTLVVHRDRIEQTPVRWQLDVDLGLKMCRDAGVKIVCIEGPVHANVSIRFDGQQIEV